MKTLVSAFLAILLVAPVTSAAEEKVNYSPVDLAAGKIQIPPDKWQNVKTANRGHYTTDAKDCALTIDANGIITPHSGDPSKCSALWKKPKPQTLSIMFGQNDPKDQIDLTPSPAPADTITVSLKDDKVLAKEKLSSTTRAAAYSPDDGLWKEVTITNGKELGLPSSALEQAKQGNPVQLYLLNGSTLTSITLKKTKDPAQNGQGNRSRRGARDTSWCVLPPNFRNHALLCADAVGTNIETVDASDHVIKPNTPVLLIIRHQPGAEVQITIDGTVGLYTPGVDNQTHKSINTTQSGTEEEPADEPKPETTPHSFAPRRPGNANVHIAVGGEELTIELIVEETYSGAVRIGVGSVWGNAVDRTYAAQALPGSSQSEIVATGNSLTDVELTLGFSSFIFDGPRGRSYATRKRSYFAPFVAIGLLNQKQNALELLKSVYVGVEFEPMPNFSIGAGIVGRRVTKLIPPFRVGMPVDPTNGVPTTTGYQLGFGLVFNVSPDFLRFASLDSSTFFR